VVRGVSWPRSSGSSNGPAEPSACAQIEQRLAGEAITDRLASMFDPDARPIRKGKVGKPNEFGYVPQVCGVTQNTKQALAGSSRRRQASTAIHPRAS
jgi:hypothetical protein